MTLFSPDRKFHILILFLMGFLPGAIVVTPRSKECYLLAGLGVTHLCSTLSTCFSHSCLVMLLVLARSCYTFCLAGKSPYISNCGSSISLITHSPRTILPAQQPNSIFSRPFSLTVPKGWNLLVGVFSVIHVIIMCH